MPPPQSIVCEICGGKFSKHSLVIHQRQCVEKREKSTACACGRVRAAPFPAEHFATSAPRRPSSYPPPPPHPPRNAAVCPCCDQPS